MRMKRLLLTIVALACILPLRAQVSVALEGAKRAEVIAAILKAKKAIRKAFEYSMQGKGSNLVEIVSTCNTNWRMTPDKANKWMEENMVPFYPLGDLKDKG